MTTNIPPHNLNELADAVVALIENPAVTVAELMQHVPGPDFPTAGFIHGNPDEDDGYSVPSWWRKLA